MPLGTVAPTPREGQGAPLLDYVEPQRPAAPAAGTALHDHHQGLEGSLCQKERDRGEHIPLLPEALVVEPSGQALPSALRLGALGDLWWRRWGVGAVAAHDTAAERRQRGQVPGDGAGGLARLPWC